MKKLLTVSVLAIMAVSTANADIASTTYVESRTGDVVLSGTNYVSGQTELTGAVRALDTQIKANAGDVVTLKGKADSAAAAISDLQTVDQTLQAEIAKKQVKLKVAADSAIKLAEDGTMTLEGIATSTELGNIQSAITKLDGAENVEGSVKKQIADAIASEVTRSDRYADAAEQAAKDYADGLAGNYDAAGSAATAKSEAIAAAKTETENQVKALADGQVAANASAIAGMDATFAAQEGKYIASVSQEDGTVTATYADLTDVAKMQVPEVCNGTATCALVWNKTTQKLDWEAIMQ